jgi:geranylgeranyl diphosphate synthase type I
MGVDKDEALTKLAEYKREIDADIEAYATDLRSKVGASYGAYVLETEANIFLDLLSRGGKRIRGALTMAGYEMCGGTDRAMITQAARAIEMLQAYMLMIDDVQDRSDLRRGKPSAHKMVEAYHIKHKLKGDPAQAGINMALNAALAGAHSAQEILANLEVDPQLRLSVISITNHTMVITAHGQTMDIMNQLIERPSKANVERVLEWKTALYTVVNPLHVGMILAGAYRKAIDAITPFGAYAGKAFQITDDILGIYGDEKELGKTPGDDIREGKGTLLIMHALEHATTADKTFLQQCLGNSNLTFGDFETCRRIIKDSGALAYAREQAAGYLGQALTSLDKPKGLWSQEGTDFLKGIAYALQNRVA